MSEAMILMPGEPIASIHHGDPWKILVVDDDEQVHKVTALALTDYHFKGRPVTMLSAYSKAEALTVLDAHDDIALILLDVIMESEHAGLEMVRNIREHRRNALARIVLRTGQPGQAPALEVIQRYDIDDYRTKTELTFERLHIVVTSALRTYDLLCGIIESRRKLAHMVNHDALTGLPNRTLLTDRMDQYLALAQRSHQRVAVLFIDIDGFKFVNDSYGHSLGDQMLCALAARMQERIREGDTVARLGGDEFVVVLNGIQSAGDAAEIAKKLLATLPMPLMVGGKSIMITASIGISLYPEDGGDTETLLKNADAALYSAKQNGKNCVQAYNQKLSTVSKERVAMESALRQAVALEQFDLHYQPIIDFNSRVVIGAEALIRWTHPALGVVSPITLISLAEELGLIGNIGEWVLRTACRQLSNWRRAGYDQLTVAVNMSARQFYQQDVVTMVQEVLSASGLPPQALDLEVTESILIGNAETVMDTLQALRKIGVALSMDDFGTGYSSLSYLHRFPIDTIKIDRSFTSKVPMNPQTATIVHAIIALAQALKMKTIGEGVETEAQATFLQESGCDAFQGYYYSPALPPAEFAALLEKQPLAGAASQVRH
jgi:diguanylate cyclase (GGDEF)-like protein